MSTKYRDLLTQYNESATGAVHDFLAARKEASARKVMQNFATGVGNATMAGVGGAIASAAVTGVAMGAQKAYQALTRERDMRNMLEANAELAEHHQSNPKGFNLAYNSLRAMNPEFAADPVIAGAYMRKAMENPGVAGGIFGELGLQSKRTPNRFMDSIQSNAASSFRMPREEGPMEGRRGPVPIDSNAELTPTTLTGEGYSHGKGRVHEGRMKVKVHKDPMGPGVGGGERWNTHKPRDW
jgi:hypothetical protein